MSDIIDISVGLTEERVEINSTPNVIEVNIITGQTINPLSYDLIDFTNISPNPFVQYSALGSYTPISRALTINGVTQDLSANRNWNVGTVTSVGLSMPSAFSVASSPIIGAGTIAVTGAGVVSQYIRGDGSLANFPTLTGGGASVSYYLNGSVSQGTIGGVAYKEINNVPIIGAGTDFTINANGYIAQFITDVGDPNKLLIPAGNWNFETYFSASSGGGSPQFYIELYKYNGTTFTLIASNSATPENITGGTAIDLYFTALAVPATTLLATDRIAVRFYVIHSGRIITMHTEDNHLSQIITTFSTGLTALNGLTSQVQYFAVGTTGTDFNISSVTDTHTFNLPTASATNRGALSSADWTTFNNKVPTTRTLTINGTTQDLSADRTFTISTGITIGTTAITSGTVGRVLFEGTGNVVQESANLFWDNTNGRLGIGTITPNAPIHIVYNPASQNGINIDGTVNSLNHIAFSRSGIVYGRLGVNASSGEFRWDCGAASSGYFPTIYTNGSERFRIVASTGNVLINTTTDAGFKLDVNGTARVQGSLLTDLLTLSAPGRTIAFNLSSVGGTFSNISAPQPFGIVSSGFGGIVLIGPSSTTSAAVMGVYLNSGSAIQTEVIIGTQTSNASAILNINSTARGFLPPRMTTTQRDAIASPATGLQIYNTTTNTNDTYNGTAWASEVTTVSPSAASNLFNYYNFI